MNNKVTLATIALNHQLYVPGWNLENHYQEIIHHGDKSHYYITLMFEQNKPVAAATLHIHENIINLYVEQTHRGKGIGISIIEQILTENSLQKNDVYAFFGQEGSELFYEKAQIACFDGSVPLSKKEIDDYLAHNIEYHELIKIKIDEKLKSYKKIILKN